ncbi:hypothetical protein BH11PLA2_BH11PLA2_31540 [soil metagenome]
MIDEAVKSASDAISVEETSTPTDAALLQQYRRGENDAATELYFRYAERLRSLTKAQTSPVLQQRIDTEDIVQSVFRTFFRRAAAGQYQVPDGEELWMLFLVIGLNKIRTAGVHHTAAKRDVRRTTAGEGFDRATAVTAAEDETALATLRMTIDELLGPLPPSYREVIDLRIAGHDVNEIARVSKRAKRSVERILQEFRDLLQERIHDRS